MKMESVPVTEQKSLTPAETTPKRAWIEPEITWHKELKAVTLATQCANTFPHCTTAVPVNV